MIFNKQSIDFTKEPLFLGTGRNISRLDLSIEPHITKMHQEALGKLWFGGDFSPSKDAKDYISVDSTLRDLFLKNLKFQTLLDSIAARSVSEVFLPITTNPQLEAWWYQHAFFENCIHSQSYADIIKGMPVDAKAVFDDIMINGSITARAKSIVDEFELTIKHNYAMDISDHYNKESHKKSIIMSLFALNILEAVLFKSSFLTSFAFKENGLFSVTGDIISKIAQDEAGHYAMTVNLLNRHRQDPDWAYIFNDNKEEIENLYRTALEADYEWIDYCYPDGTRMLGVNNAVVKQYVTYNIHSVMTSVGLTPIVDKLPNPCVWASKYTKPSNVQTAQKEKTTGNYLLGIVDTDISNEEWENMGVCNG